MEDLEEILADDEIDEEMQKGMRDEFDEMKTAYPDIFPNNPPPRKYIIEFCFYGKYNTRTVQMISIFGWNWVLSVISSTSSTIVLR